MSEHQAHHRFLYIDRPKVIVFGCDPDGAGTGARQPVTLSVSMALLLTRNASEPQRLMRRNEGSCSPMRDLLSAPAMQRKKSLSPLRKVVSKGSPLSTVEETETPTTVPCFLMRERFRADTAQSSGEEGGVQRADGEACPVDRHLAKQLDELHRRRSRAIAREESLGLGPPCAQGRSISDPALLKSPTLQR